MLIVACERWTSAPLWSCWRFTGAFVIDSPVPVDTSISTSPAATPGAFTAVKWFVPTRSFRSPVASQSGKYEK